MKTIETIRNFIKQPGRRAARLAFFSALACAGALVADRPAHAETFGFDLDEVKVVTQREASGDRPYFGVIYFHSKISTPGSTSVEVASWEPHDWVSKPIYRVGLPAGRDHMFAGERVALPFWMGHHQWRDITVVPDLHAHPEHITDALHADIVGAIAISLDNNNTPPHVVRGLMDNAGTIVRQLLVEQVESGGVVRALGNPTLFQQNLGNRAKALVMQMLDAGRVLELAVQLTVGSTFNPDQPTGVQAFILPAIEGMTPQDTTSAAGPMQARVVFASLGARRETLDFTGSGAHYQTPLVLAPVRCTPGAPVTMLDVKVHAGEDGARDNTVVHMFLDTARHGRINLTLPTPGGIASRGDVTHRLLVPAGISRSDLLRVGMAVELHNTRPFEENDRFDVAALKVMVPGETMVMRTGRPFVQLNDGTREWSTDIACPAAPPPADPLVSELEVTIRTGGDDLRGGNDNAAIVVPVGSLPPHDVSFNGTARLPDNSSRTIRVPLPTGTHLSALHTFTVKASLGGGIGGDNWNIDAIQVRALSPSLAPRTLLDRSGGPLARLTGDNHVVTFPLGR